MLSSIELSFTFDPVQSQTPQLTVFPLHLPTATQGTNRHIMSAKSPIRHFFRHGGRDKVGEDALPLGLKLQGTELAENAACESSMAPNIQLAPSGTLLLPTRTPEPFGLENIAEEDTVESPSVSETASLTETLASLDLEISTFSTRELVHATLDEAKSAATLHLDTINTTLSLLDALDGFSATISELRVEITEKKQACEEQMMTLDAVARAIEGMVFA